MMKYLMLATISLPVVLSGTFALAYGAGMAGGRWARACKAACR